MTSAELAREVFSIVEKKIAPSVPQWNLRWRIRCELRVKDPLRRKSNGRDWKPDDINDC